MWVWDLYLINVLSIPWFRTRSWRQQYKPNSKSYIIFVSTLLIQQQRDNVNHKVVVKYCFSRTRHKDRKLLPLWWHFSKTTDQYDLFSVIINRRKRVSIIGENSVLISENRWSMTLSGSRTGAQGDSKPVWSTPDRHISWGHSSLPDTSCMLPPDLNSTQSCLSISVKPVS